MSCILKSGRKLGVMQQEFIYFPAPFPLQIFTVVFFDRKEAEIPLWLKTLIFKHAFWRSRRSALFKIALYTFSPSVFLPCILFSDIRQQVLYGIYIEKALVLPGAAGRIYFCTRCFL